MFKVNNVFIVNFEHISHLFSRVSIIDFEQVNVSCVKIKLMDGKIREYVVKLSFVSFAGEGDV